MTTTAPDYAAKISALLAKAEDPAATPAEAETYTAKAEQLMVKWGISDAELDSRRRGKNKREEVVEQRIVYTGLHAMSRVMLGMSVASGLGIRSLKGSNSWNKSQTLYLIGHTSDVERAVTLLNSLIVQQDAALAAWWSDPNTAARNLPQYDGRKARRQFQLSFGNAVGSRLTRARRDAEGEATTATPGTELVLVDRKAAVDSWVTTTYPKLGTARGLAGSNYGRAEGRAAGQRASLGNKGVGGNKGELS